VTTRAAVHGRRAGERSSAARRWVVLLTVLVVTAACGGGSDPDEELASAVAATADEPIRFSLGARADRAALEQLGDDALAAASFLEGAGLEGARTPDGRLHAIVRLGGPAPLLEVVTGPGEALLLRTGLAEALGVDDRDPMADLGPALESRGVGPAGRDALATSFAGGWVAVTDVADLGQLLDAAYGGDEAATGDAAARAPRDLAAVLDEVVVLDATDAGEVRRFEVEVPASAVLAPFGLDGGDRTLTGTVDLRAGRLLEVRLQLDGAALGDAAGDPGPGDGTESGSGNVELVLRIDPVDDTGAVPRPTAGASLTAPELLDLVERLEVAGGPADDPAP
jgi:hypothetical protein